MNEQIKISWYRCTVDKAVMSELMRKNDGRAFLQAGGHLLLYAATGTAAYLAYLNVHARNGMDFLVAHDVGFPQIVSADDDAFAL